jgi:hypothetical protein
MRTFHPNVIDAAAAIPITVRDGDEITGIDIDIRTSTARTYSIFGIAINPVPNLPTNVTTGVVNRTVTEFFLVPREPSLLDGVLSPQFVNAIPIASRPNGEFEIRNVKPGAYDLYPAYADYANHRYFLAHTPVDVRSADVSGLSLTLSMGQTLTAEVVVEGNSEPPIKLDSLRLNLETLGSTPGLAGTIMAGLPFDANGKLTARNIPESRYSVSLTGLSPDAFIADVRQDAHSVYDVSIDIGPMPKPVQIIVNPKGATVSGLVQSTEHQPVFNADIILVPSSPHRHNAGLFKVARTDSDGRFSITGIMPGAYSIFALQQSPPREPWLNSDFLAKFQDRWTDVTVDAISTADVQLEAISN